jgi:ubiquinone/menaquinone biosynthesis C-methylase UbiE
MLVSSDERFDESQRGRFRGEHLHRYRLATALAAGRDVLDIACGEGYGSAALARVARSVVGVDIAEEVVAHATHTYAGDGLRFLNGSCDAIPLADSSVDLIVSFETIEHHDRHDEMMTEFRRVLRPGGLVVLSSPNREIYSADHVNPFHVKELSRAELTALLERHFPHVALAGQRSWLASLTYADAREATLIAPDALPEPEYFLALASTSPLTVSLPTEVFLDNDDAMEYVETLYSESQAAQKTLEEQYRHLESEYEKQKNSYKNLESEYKNTHQNLNSEYQKQITAYKNIELEYKKNQKELQELKSEYKNLETEYNQQNITHKSLEESYKSLESSYFSQRDQLQQAREREQALSERLQAQEATLEALRQSAAYRVGRRLGLAPTLDEEKIS